MPRKFAACCWMGMICVCLAELAAAVPASLANQSPPRVTVTVVPNGESRTKASDVRTMVVGPGVNEPEPFPGYRGSVAWAGVASLKRDILVVAFNAGYWHVSPPTPYVMPPDKVEYYRSLGMPRDVVAPTGGRIMFVRSEDGGKTWSKPRTLADTPADDRQAGLTALPDGTLLASFFTSFGEVDPWGDPAYFSHTLIVRSFDDGRTWEKHPRLLQKQSGSPFQGEASDGPAIVRKDGSLLLTTYGFLPASEHTKFTAAGVYTSRNDGKTWKLLSIVKADHHLEEPHTAELPDGRLVMISRPRGEITWSSDGGKTWTPLADFGMPMAAPTLYVLRDGTLLCLFKDMSPNNGGRLAAIFSTDGGKTWIAPAANRGFLVDNAYGYGAAALLPDGSLYVIYQNTGSHRANDAKANSLLAVRLWVRADHSGIEILPPVEALSTGNGN